MKRINFYLTNRQIEDLAQLKAITGLSVSELVRRAIDRFLEEENKRKKVTIVSAMRSENSLDRS